MRVIGSNRKEKTLGEFLKGETERVNIFFAFSSELRTKLLLNCFECFSVSRRETLRRKAMGRLRFIWTTLLNQNNAHIFNKLKWHYFPLLALWCPWVERRIPTKLSCEKWLSSWWPNRRTVVFGEEEEGVEIKGGWSWWEHTTSAHQTITWYPSVLSYCGKVSETIKLEKGKVSWANSLRGWLYCVIPVPAVLGPWWHSTSWWEHTIKRPIHFRGPGSTNKDTD